MPELIAQKTKVNSIQWKVAGILPSEIGQAKALGVAGPVTGVHNDVLIVAGGANFPDAMPWLGGKKKYHDEAYVFKTKNDTLIHHKTIHLSFSIAYSAVCSTPQGVLAVGGENENGISNKVFLLQWNNSTDNTVIKDLPHLPFAITNASAVIHHDKIYVAGGERANDVSAELLVLDINNTAASWKKLSSLPKPVSHAVMVVQSDGDEDCIYILGGRKRNPGSISNLYSSVLRYNFKTGKWSEGEQLPYALSAGTGIATANNSIILFGGDAGETFHKTEALIAAINKETVEERKKQLNEEKTKVQSTHPGFCRQVFLYDAKKDKWEKLDCVPFDVPVTTTAVQWNGKVLIPSGEIKAGVRTAQILSVKVK